MYSTKRALFTERIVRNSRQPAVQLVVRKNIIGTTKSIVNLPIKAKIIEIVTIIRTINTMPNTAAATKPLLAIVIAIRPAAKRQGSPITAKPIKPNTILNKNRLLACCRNFVQGTLTSALFSATQWRNINRPRLLSQVKTSHSTIINITPIKATGMIQPRFSKTNTFAPPKASRASDGPPLLLPPFPPPPPFPKNASQAQKPITNHLRKSKGLKSIVFTFSKAGPIGSITLTVGGRCGVII